MKEIEENLLDRYEEINLDNKANRRIAFRIMEDLYGSLITEKAVGAFDIDTTNNDSFGTYWRKVEGKINPVDSIEHPGKLSKVLKNIGSKRTEVSHDYTKGVSKEDLEKMRESYSEFKDWIEDSTKKADRYYSNLDAKEMLEEEIRETLLSAQLNLKEPQISVELAEPVGVLAGDSTASKEADLRRKLGEYQMLLNKLEKNKEIEKEHIQLMRKSTELKEKASDLQDDEGLFELI